MDTSIQTLPDYNAACLRAVGPYGPEVEGKAFKALGEWAAKNDVMDLVKNPGMKYMGLYYDDPETTAPEECRTDACVVVPEGTEGIDDIEVRTVEGGKFFVAHVQITPDRFMESWNNAMAELMKAGHEHECDSRPCREIFYNCPSQHPAGMFVVDLCIPVKG